MTPMGRRRCAVLAVVGMVLALAACQGEQPASSSTEVGDQIQGRVKNIETGKKAKVLVPAGRLTVSFGDPVDRLTEDDTADLTERTAPEGATFVPLVWKFEDDQIYGEIAQLFGDREPVRIELVTGGKTYPLTPPEATPGKKAVFVVVKGDAERPKLEVTYDGETQALHASTGKIDKGLAAGLYDLPKTKIRMKDCPTNTWTPPPLTYLEYECRYSTAVASPYVANKWVKKRNQTWLSVTLATNLLAYATGSPGEIASFDVVRSKELSTINGEESLGTLDEQVVKGAATGTVVFDIRGKLPTTMNVLREYKLKLSGASGKVDAPRKRTVKLGGEIELVY